MNIELDMNLLKLCGKHYWFVGKQQKLEHKEIVYLERPGYPPARAKIPSFTHVWEKQYLLLDEILIDEFGIEYRTVKNDDEFGPLFTNHDFIVETEEEADRLLAELNETE